jgi:hypothetical protein
MPTCGRSTAELVAVMEVPQSQALAVLRGLERDGLAVLDLEHGWRLSDEAERAYRRALRLFAEWLAELEAQAA